MTPPPALWAKGSAELGLPPPPSSKVPPWLPCEVATKKKPCGLEAFSGLASPEVRRLPLPLLSCVRRSWVGSWNFYNHSEVTKPPDSVVLGQAHGAQLPRPSPPPRQGGYQPRSGGGGGGILKFHFFPEIRRQPFSPMCQRRLEWETCHFIPH